MKPNVLSLYIARRFTATVLLIVFSVGLVIFIADYVEVLRRFVDEERYTTLLGLRLAFMRVPILLDTALPFAFLFAALISLLDLSRTLELVVARASGVSAWGFLRAPFVVAVIFGGAATALLNPLAVDLSERAQNIQAEIAGRAPPRGGYWFRQESSAGPSIIHAGSAEADGRVIFGVTAFVFDSNGRFHEKVASPRAEYAPNRWIMSDAVVASTAGPHSVGRYELPTELTSAELRRTFVKPKAISIWSLPGYIDTARRIGLNPDRFRVAFHALVSRPFFFVAMVMIAATVSLRLARYGGTWRLILTGAAIGFLLYAFSEIANDLGGNGIVNPVLAAWLPPIVAMTLGSTALLFQEDG